MKKTKKIKGYSFDCPECGTLEYDNTYNHSVSKQRTCRFCGKIIKFTEHIIEVPDLPEVGRIVKIENANFDTLLKIVKKYEDSYIYFEDKDTIDDDFLDIQNIVNWCHMKEDK